MVPCNISIEDKIRKIKYSRMTFPERFITDYMEDMKEVKIINGGYKSRYWIKDDKIVFQIHYYNNSIRYRNRDLFEKIEKYFNNRQEVNNFVLEHFCRKIEYTDILNISSCTINYDTSAWYRLYKKHKQFNENIYR